MAAVPGPVPANLEMLQATPFFVHPSFAYGDTRYEGLTLLESDPLWWGGDIKPDEFLLDPIINMGIFEAWRK